ncbi:hypothetical protein FRC01_013529 [Tulasnella sp. 417]|nr:hypothetical protein FRC01_013529 [Tulasnella sp. 417]
MSMLRSLQKSVRPALSSSWRAAQPGAPGSASALGLGFSLPAPAHPTPNRNGNRAFHKAFTSANWRQDPAAPAVSESAPKAAVDPAVTKFVGIWNVPKDATEEEIRAYLVQECGIDEEVGIRMVLSERHSGWNVFLDLKSIEAAQKAIEAIVKTPFKNMSLHASSSRGPKAPNGKTNTVVIGNVGRQIPPEELSTYLQKNFTGVKSARIAEIRIPAVFVQFENEDYAEVALEELKAVDTIQMPSGQQTHRIFATFANQSHGQPVVRGATHDDWETASQVSSVSRVSRSSRRPPRTPSTPGTKLWVGNLAENYDQAGLKTLFSQNSGFSSVYFPESDGSRRPRWARVDFESRNAAQAALNALNGSVFGGEALNVQFARTR